MKGCTSEVFLATKIEFWNRVMMTGADSSCGPCSFNQVWHVGPAPIRLPWKSRLHTHFENGFVPLARHTRLGFLIHCKKIGYGTRFLPNKNWCSPLESAETPTAAKRFAGQIRQPVLIPACDALKLRHGPLASHTSTQGSLSCLDETSLFTL